MSEAPQNAPQSVHAASPLPAKGTERPSRIRLYSYPKVVFLYPLFIASLLIAIYLSFVSRDLIPGHTPGWVLTTAFLCLFGVNLVVLAFDFPRTTSLTLFFFIVAVVMALILLFTFEPNLFPAIERFFARFRPFASGSFYWAFAGILGAVLLASLISVRFDYWEVRENELLHYHGILANLERYPSPNLHVNKEINDIFEFLLLRSGRLIIHMSGEKRAIILDNVPWIEKKEAALTRMLETLHVQVRTEDAPE